MIKGITAGAFDVMHPGYIKMFKEAKEHCDYLLVALHDDPTVERPKKIKPILTLEERKETLLALRYVDEIVTYNTEKELTFILENSNADIRFLGDDYKGKTSTRSHLEMRVYYVDRSHGWSATKFKTLIYEQINGKNIL
jgi:glycerol-3-phosphate cytidylyltransferase